VTGNNPRSKIRVDPHMALPSPSHCSLSPFSHVFLLTSLVERARRHGDFSVDLAEYEGVHDPWSICFCLIHYWGAWVSPH
jgi:hypothetical protein